MSIRVNNFETAIKNKIGLLKQTEINKFQKNIEQIPEKKQQLKNNLTRKRTELYNLQRMWGSFTKGKEKDKLGLNIRSNEIEIGKLNDKLKPKYKKNT